jgi:hypothetical protein
MLDLDLVADKLKMLATLMGVVREPSLRNSPLLDH